MTRASELFHNRRSRRGGSALELGLDSPLPRFSQDHRSNRRPHHSSGDARYDSDGCRPIRISAHLRHQFNRPHLQGNVSVQLDLAGCLPAPGNIANLESFSSTYSGHRFNGNDRLPGPVLLARERLLQRLRGVSAAGDRQNSSVLPVIHRNDSIFGYDLRHADAARGLEPEISREWQTRTTTLVDSIIQPGQQPSLRGSRKRPPGLTREAVNCLCVKTFCDSGTADEGTRTSRSSHECSICLDRFVNEDELICLPCGHMFHSPCLYPWVEVCGDCPYCRAGIVATSASSAP